jgi:RNA polymerase sigma-70 factor (ECF subfamily)
MRTDLTQPESFEILVREHERMVFRTLTRLTDPGPHVEDLAQEVFLRLYRALPEFRGDAALSTYLYRIVVNVAQDEWKRRRRDRSRFVSRSCAEDDDGDDGWIEQLPGSSLTQHGRTPQQHMEQAELQDSVDDALRQLPEMERAVLVLYHQEECSYEGIAAALALPLNTVRTHLHRGRRRLGEMVKLHARQQSKALDSIALEETR